MQEYLDLLRAVRTRGVKKEDRTGTGTLSLFGWSSTYHTRLVFPLLTTKRVWFKGVVHELLWFLRGETNIRSLQAEGVHIWDGWADENGDLGPVYGSQWRSWRGLSLDGHATTVDQIGAVIRSLRESPDSRRHIVSAWNPVQIEDCALPPCHCMFQFGVGREMADGRRELNCHMYQRSADLFLGVPFNIASYALLLHMVAQVTGLAPGELRVSYGDVHIYLNHLDQVDEQLSREPRTPPTLKINTEVRHINGFVYEDFTLVGYTPHPAIKGDVSV